MPGDPRSWKSRFDADIRSVLDSVGKQENVSADKARREPDWTMRPIEETLLDTAASLFARRLVRA